MRLAVVAAMARNRVIGAGNALPWHLPADLRHFKRLTMGHCLLMGRKTFAAIGRPLPGRSTIVLTRDRGYQAAGVIVAHSLPEALAAARRQAGGDDVFIAGGADLYGQSLELAERLHLTLIDRDFEGDAYFPVIDPDRWRLVSEERHGPIPLSAAPGETGAPDTAAGDGPLRFGFPHRFSFLLYERRLS